MANFNMEREVHAPLYSLSQAEILSHPCSIGSALCPSRKLPCCLRYGNKMGILTDGELVFIDIKMIYKK